MSPHLDAIALSPEIVVVATLVLVLLVDLFIPDAKRRWLTAISVVGVAGSLVATVLLLVTSHHARMVGGTYVVDDFALLTKALFIGSTLLVLVLGAPREWKGEYLLLVLSSLLGAVLVVSARELVTFVVAFELLAVPGYLLTGWRKQTSLGHEAALKFYLLGVVATAVMLYGVSLIFGIAGSTNFTRIANEFSGPEGSSPLAVVAILFLVAGMAFKFSAVPLHFWAPDAYQGAPLPVAAFLSVISKAAGIFALAEVVLLALPDASQVWAPVLAIFAIVTMTVGNVTALRQPDFVRLIAYSSIAQTGYALVPVAVVGYYGASASLGLESLYEFLLIYAVTNIAAFAVAIAVARDAGSTSIDSLEGLLYTYPMRAIALITAMLSLAGIPPFGGWFAKLVVFRSGIEAGSVMGIALVVIAAINTAIGLFYYARVIARTWNRSNITYPAVPIPRNVTITLGISVFLVLLTGVLPFTVTYLGEMMSFTS